MAWILFGGPIWFTDSFNLVMKKVLILLRVFFIFIIMTKKWQKTLRPHHQGLKAKSENFLKKFETHFDLQMIINFQKIIREVFACLRGLPFFFFGGGAVGSQYFVQTIHLFVSINMRRIKLSNT